MAVSSFVIVTTICLLTSPIANVNGYAPVTPSLILANCVPLTSTFEVKTVPSAFHALTPALSLAVASVKALASSPVIVKFFACKNLDPSGAIAVLSS